VNAHRKKLLTRRFLIVANAALGVMLVASLAVLLWNFSSRGYVTRGGEVVAGVRPVLTIEGPGRGHYPAFVRPMAAAFGPDGFLHVLDSGNDRVVVLEMNGRYGLEFGGFGAVDPPSGLEPSWSEGRMNHPVGIDVDEAGNIYVADLRNEQVQVFDPTGAFVRRFPDPGETIGSEASGGSRTGVAATDVAVAGGSVFVAAADRIVVFTTEGEFVRQFNRAARDSIGFDTITGIDASDDGLIYVADSGNSRILVLTDRGALVWTVGVSRKVDAPSSTVEPVSPYEFALPRDIAVMVDGSVAVLDAAESSIVLFSRDGALQGRHGTRGSTPGAFSAPSSIDARGDLLLVTDTGNNRVQVVQVVR